MYVRTHVDVQAEQYSDPDRDIEAGDAGNDSSHEGMIPVECKPFPLVELWSCG